MPRVLQDWLAPIYAWLTSGRVRRRLTPCTCHWVVQFPEFVSVIPALQSAGEETGCRENVLMGGGMGAEEVSVLCLM